MPQEQSAKDLNADDALSSYRFVQLMIAVVAFLLPIVTIWYVRFINHLPMDSISMTYHSPRRDLFVGFLCALGLAFMSYGRRGVSSRDKKAGKGKYRADGWLAIVTGLSALGIALFPTAPCESPGFTQRCPGYASAEIVVSTIHAALTGVLMVLIVVFCLFRFVKVDTNSTDQRLVSKVVRGLVPNTSDNWKKQTNWVYRWSGRVIVVSIVYIGVVNLLAFANPDDLKPSVGLAETLAIWAFGLAWLTKSGYYGWFLVLLRLFRRCIRKAPQ